MSEIHKCPSPDHKQDLVGRFASHKVAANLLMLIMIIAGVFGITKLNRQFLPTHAHDFITINVSWPGATAEDVEKSITTPIEQALQSLSNVKEIRSSSRKSASAITVEYRDGTNILNALNEVKDHVSLVKNLPAEAESPQITQHTRNESIAKVLISTKGTLEEIRPVVYQFRRELLDLGVAQVSLTGMPDQEVQIQVNSNRIAELGLSLDKIGEKIALASQDMPIGEVGQKESSREVRVLEKRITIDGFLDIPVITSTDGQLITVGDIGDVRFDIKEDSVRILHDGKPSVLMQLQRSESGDTLESARIMREWISNITPTLPESISLTVVDEHYTLVENRIDLMLENGVGGLVLVICILYLFLNGRVAFWVAAGIPISFMGALAIIYLNGGTINMMSLFALIMALGIIVDDAIVVGEDALAHYQKGESGLTAAEGGARRMLVPVICASLTTIAAFLPLMLVDGVIGNILRDVPFVVICVIIASLVESFLILPGHLRQAFGSGKRKEGRARLWLDKSFDKFRDRLFRKLIKLTIRYRGTTLLIAISFLVAAGSLVTSKHVKFHFFPQPEAPIIYASAKFLPGTTSDIIERFGVEMERSLKRVNTQLSRENGLVKASYIRFNEASFDGGRSFETGDQYVSVFVELLAPDMREIRNRQFIDLWKRELRPVPGIEKINIASPKGGPPGRDLDIFFSGGNAQELKQAASLLIDKLGRYEGVSNIHDDLPYGKKVLQVELTPIATSNGLTITDIGKQMRAAIDGQVIQSFHTENEEIDVRVILPAEERHSRSLMDTLPIITPSGQAVQLTNLINTTESRGIQLLRHTDGILGIHVTADVDNDVANTNEILDHLKNNDVPEIIAKHGLKVAYLGKSLETKETNSDLIMGVFIALTLIYIVLAWAFSSYTWPFAVLLVIPFGIAGALFGHWVMGLDLTIFSQFGLFGLSGIVINNSIILITFYKDLRGAGESFDMAMVNAACLRLRPMVLTSVTTIAGLTPLILEQSLEAQFLIPMAVSLAFGLGAATVLVLFIVPVFLSYIESTKRLFDKTKLTKAPLIN